MVYTIMLYYHNLSWIFIMVVIVIFVVYNIMVYTKSTIYDHIMCM